jgi:hypothetical protein
MVVHRHGEARPVAMRLSICLSYYENPAMLQEQQRQIEQYPLDIRYRVTLVIGDDGSTERPAHKAALQPWDYDLQVYRIREHVPWGQKGARNLATFHAPEGWMLVTDIDHVLAGDAAATLWTKELDPECYYIPARRKVDGTSWRPHPNTYLITRKLFWDDVGGCNEDLDGWYGTDSPFRERVALYGRRMELHDVPLTVYNLGGEDIGGIPGAATRAHGRKGSEFHVKRNNEIRALVERDRLLRPPNPLRRPWERMI